jgi:3-methyladenine DNA glycosylase AlkC
MLSGLEDRKGIYCIETTRIELPQEYDLVEERSTKVDSNSIYTTHSSTKKGYMRKKHRPNIVLTLSKYPQS